MRSGICGVVAALGLACPWAWGAPASRAEATVDEAGKGPRRGGGGTKEVVQTVGAAADNGTKTKVVILGTGTPAANPDASGPAVAIVVNGAAYLVDCGPGVVRRAAAAERKGIAALKVQN